MDTILYLYKKKDIDRPLVEAVRQDTYMLVKVGLDVEPYRWFIQRLPRKQPKPEITAMNGRKLEGWDWINPRYFRERREIRFRRNEWKRYERLIDTLTVRCSESAEGLLSEMMEELSPYVGDRSDCCCVYENTVREILYGDNPAAKVWQKLWKWKEFDLYTELSWVRLLMPFAVNHHFVVLGSAPCVPEILTQYADRMKSLRWIMDETYGEAHSEELEDFAEEFYQEQGLAVTIERVQNLGTFRLNCAEPSNILDFTGEDRVLAGETGKGSVWLDMCSSEEKCRRFTQRGAGIKYISLREKWRKTQKKSYRLDTTGKNEYNT